MSERKIYIIVPHNLNVTRGGKPIKLSVTSGRAMSYVAHAMALLTESYKVPGLVDLDIVVLAIENNTDVATVNNPAGILIFPRDQFFFTYYDTDRLFDGVTLGAVIAVVPKDLRIDLPVWKCACNDKKNWAGTSVLISQYNDFAGTSALRPIESPKISDVPIEGQPKILCSRSSASERLVSNQEAEAARHESPDSGSSPSGSASLGPRCVA